MGAQQSTTPNPALQLSVDQRQELVNIIEQARKDRIKYVNPVPNAESKRALYIPELGAHAFPGNQTGVYTHMHDQYHFSQYYVENGLLTQKVSYKARNGKWILRSLVIVRPEDANVCEDCIRILSIVPDPGMDLAMLYDQYLQYYKPTMYVMFRDDPATDVIVVKNGNGADFMIIDAGKQIRYKDDKTDFVVSYGS